MAFSLFLLATDLLLLARGWPRLSYLWLPFCGLVASFRWLLLLGGGFDWVAFGLLFFPGDLLLWALASFCWPVAFFCWLGVFLSLHSLLLLFGGLHLISCGLLLLISLLLWAMAFFSGSWPHFSTVAFYYWLSSFNLWALASFNCLPAACFRWLLASSCEPLAYTVTNACFLQFQNTNICLLPFHCSGKVGL